jgi:hypothetical protein
MRLLLAENKALSGVICVIGATAALAYTGLMLFLGVFCADYGSTGGACFAGVMKFPVIVDLLAGAAFLVAVQRRWWVITLVLTLTAAAVAWASLGIKGLLGY